MPRAFWILWAGTLINRLGYFVIPFLTLYLVRQGFEPAMAGAVVSAFGAGSLISQPLGGWLADRWGRRPAVVAGMLATAAAYLALGAAASLPVLAVCAFAAGLATDVYRPAVAAIVADIVAPERRRHAYALLYWAINLGVGVASVLGGWLAERDFWLLFVIDAATCTAFAVVVLLGVPESKPAEKSTGSVADARLIALAASTFAVAVVFFQGFVTMPLAMAADGLDARAYGLVSAVNPAVILVCQPLLVRLSRDGSLIKLYAAGGVLTGVGFGLVLAVDSAIGYAATVVVWSIGEILLNIAAPALLAGIAPVSLRGRYQGVWGASWGLGMLVAPILGTYTWQRFGAGPLWIGCLVVASAATLSMLTRRSQWTVVSSKN